jgi:hypothetical protein
MENQLLNVLYKVRPSLYEHIISGGPLSDSNNLCEIFGNYVLILEYILKQTTSFVLTIDEDLARAPCCSCTK